MATYVDGFLIPMKKSKLKDYKKMARLGKKVWTELGALHYFECVGDDLNVTWGLPFPKLCKIKSDETIIFSFIVYKSKKDRDRINKLAMQDKRLQKMCDPKKMPMDMKRFSSGGYKTFIQ